MKAGLDTWNAPPPPAAYSDPFDQLFFECAHRFESLYEITVVGGKISWALVAERDLRGSQAVLEGISARSGAPRCCLRPRARFRIAAVRFNLLLPCHLRVFHKNGR